MSNPKILVADDEKTIRKVLQKRLRANGYDVLLANDGEEALEQVAAGSPDLVILDLNMPFKNGYQVARELRRDDKTKHIPIIILSAWVRDKQGNDSVSVGDVYMNKPFDAEELMTTIRMLLESRQD